MDDVAQVESDTELGRAAPSQLLLDADGTIDCIHRALKYGESPVAIELKGFPGAGTNRSLQYVMVLTNELPRSAFVLLHVSGEADQVGKHDR